MAAISCVRRGACPAEDDSTTEYIVPAAADGAYAVSIADCAAEGDGDDVWYVGLRGDSGVDGAGEPLPASVSVVGSAGGGGGALTTLEPVTDGAVTEWTEDCGGGAVCSHAIVANQTHTFALDAVPGRQVLEVEVVTDGTEPGWLSLAIAPEGQPIRRQLPDRPVVRRAARGGAAGLAARRQVSAVGVHRHRAAPLGGH